jgi:hypothetical protein
MADVPELIDRSDTPRLQLLFSEWTAIDVAETGVPSS